MARRNAAVRESGGLASRGDFGDTRKQYRHRRTENSARKRETYAAHGHHHPHSVRSFPPAHPSSPDLASAQNEFAADSPDHRRRFTLLCTCTHQCSRRRPRHLTRRRPTAGNRPRLLRRTALRPSPQRAHADPLRQERQVIPEPHPRDDGVLRGLEPERARQLDPPVRDFRSAPPEFGEARSDSERPQRKVGEPRASARGVSPAGAGAASSLRSIL